MSYHKLFSLLQANSQLSVVSGERALRFVTILEMCSQRLQQPTAIEEIREIVDELLAETLSMCEANMTLCREMDRHAEEAVALLQRSAAGHA